MKHIIRLKTADGNSFETEINGTREEIKSNYFWPDGTGRVYEKRDETLTHYISIQFLDDTPDPPQEKLIKVFVDGKLWATKKIYSKFVQSRESALESAKYYFENVTGKTWKDRGTKEIEFYGGPMTYQAWREWQQEKSGIKFFGVLAIMVDENGVLIESEFLSP